MSRILKRVGLYCLLSTFFIVIVFHQFFLIQLTQWSLQTYSISKWGIPLTYEGFSWVDHQLVIIHPRLNHQTAFHADRMILKFRFNLWRRRLYVDVELEHPHWDLQTTSSPQWKDWEPVLDQKENWVKIYPTFHVKGGTLNGPFGDILHNQLYFDLKANSREGGFIKLYFDPQEKMDHYFALEASSTPQGMEVNCHCQKVYCPTLMALLQCLNIGFPSCSVTSGLLQGELKAVFPDMRRPYLDGELMIEQFAFHQKELQSTFNLSTHPIFGFVKPSEVENRKFANLMSLLAHLQSFKCENFQPNQKPGCLTNRVLEGQIGKARLKLEKNQIAYDLSDQFPTIVGQLEISEGASLTYHSPLQGWKIHQIEGNIELDPIQNVLIDLNAQVGQADHFSQWKLIGKANLNAKYSPHLDLILLCSSFKQQLGEIHLSLTPSLQSHKQIKVELKDLLHKECDTLQTLLATYWPVFKEVKLDQGNLNALVEADMTHQGIGKVHIKQFHASQLGAKLKPLNAQCYFGQIAGHGEVDLGEGDFWQSLQAAIQLDDGAIQFEGMSPQLPLSNIHAHLIINQGHVEHSLVTLQVAELKGKMDIEWGDHKQLLIFKLEGTGEDLTKLLPSPLQERLHHQFYDDRVIVLANVKRQSKQIELGGTIHFQRAGTDQMDLIHFGCELKKFHSHLASSQYVPVGWFYAHQLPLEKFLSPLIFRNGLLSMSGEAELKGSFDDHSLTIKYDVDHLKIENDDLCIEAKHLHAPIPGQLAGSHQIDLKTFAHQGILPIQQASYFEKNSGLLFQDIQGLAIFNNQSIHIQPIEAYCEGVYFGGDLKLDYSDPAPGVFNLKIQCPLLSGKVSQIQHLLAHLDQPSLIHRIPLEGEASAQGEGLKLEFDFIPKDYRLQAEYCGSIINGSLSFEDSDMALKGIDMDIDYHHQKQLLELSEIQGVLLVGKPRRVEEYLLTGPYIRFYPIAQPDIDFDIAIQDHAYELVRFVGYTKEKENGIKSLILNPDLSHISCLYPLVWQLEIKEWSQIEKFECRSQFDVGIFLQDIQRFRQTGLSFLSYQMINQLSQFLPLEGRGFLTFRHQPDQDFTYQLEVSQIKQGNGSEHYGFLNGYKQDRKWIIDRFQWDDWNVYAELERKDDKWKIPFLGFNAGRSLLFGFEGDVNLEEGFLRAKLKFCDINLDAFDECEALKPLFTKWSPKGNLKLIGDFEWDYFSSDLWGGLKASLFVDAQQLSVRDYPLHVLYPFQVELRTGRVCCLENVQIALSPQKNQAHLYLHQFEYRSLQDTLGHLHLTFQIPGKQLPLIGQTLEYHFPEMCNRSLKDMLVESKEHGDLKGSLIVDNPQSVSYFLDLKLEDGPYLFKKRKYEIKDFSLKIVENQLQFSAFTQHERYPFEVVGHTHWPMCQQGSCSLIAKGVSQPLIFQWKNHPEEGWSISSLQGEFGGCCFNLKESQEIAGDDRWAALDGQVVVDFNRLSPLLSSDTSEIIRKLNIGSPFSFKGRFWMNPELGNTLLETVFCKGEMSSQEAILKGYQMQGLQADLKYVPGRLDLKNLFIRDKAGSVKAMNLIVALDRMEDQWHLFIPRLSVKNLRLCYLRDTESSMMQSFSKFRSLLIKRIEFEDCYGKLSQLGTWQARGNLHFLNPSRKNFFYPLFAIPAEIILRLGLDPQVLNPVTGTIYFNLKGERFYLTRFKDVYSEGRGSKFYLAQSPHPSWMDFNGNLFVQVRMKQYNLIFKLAELFTVSIQGNIKKPRYTLHKQSKTSHKGEGLPLVSRE